VGATFWGVLRTQQPASLRFLNPIECESRRVHLIYLYD
jgi:alpha-D-ribose 1-methylphosphonate 5-phosphate C-P lyase